MTNRYNRVIFMVSLLLGLFLVNTFGWSASYDDQKLERVRSANSGAETRSTVGNQFVQVAAGDASGMFTIGTADGRSLLFGFPYEGSTSHTVFRIDDLLYANTSVSGTELLQAVSTQVINNSIVTRFEVANMLIIQTLMPVQTTATGAIQIKYEITNSGNTAHNVGVLLEMDTQINWNDSAPLSTSYGLVNVESSFTAPNIPTYWQAFESDTYDPALLIGQGTLVGGGAIRPDYFVCGQWGDLYSVSWDYTPDGQEYGDSAVLYRWNQVSVAPGQTVVFATFYGTGEASTSTGQLALTLAAPFLLTIVDNQLSPNPFEANLLVQNTGAQAADNVQATITLPVGLSLAQGTATQAVNPATINPGGVGTTSWQILAANPAQDVTLTYSVTVTASNAPSNTITRTIFIPHLTVGIEEPAVTSPAFRLSQNFPNPFQTNTMFNYELVGPGFVNLSIYDVAGRLLRALVSRSQSQGAHSLSWDGTADDGRLLGSGIYVYRLSVGNHTETRQLLLLR